MRKLKQAVDDYLLWMISSGYADKTIKRNEKILNHFVYFTQRHKISWDNVFCSQNIDQFHKSTKCELTAVSGFCRYLVKQNKIVAPGEKEKYQLADIYEAYLNYYATARQVNNRRMQSIRRVLAGFQDYLENKKIKLIALTIEHLDAFFAEFNGGFSPATCQVYRSIVRGFLSYLFHQRQILKRDLAPLVVGAHMFAHGAHGTFVQNVKRFQ